MSPSNSVTVNINGTSAGLNAAVQQASATLDALRATMAATADTSKVLTSSATAQGVAWVDSATNAADYSARLDVLRASLAGTADAQDLSTQAIIAATDQMRLAQETSVTLADAANLVSDAYAMQAKAFLDAATSAEDYAARLDLLQAQMAGVTASADEQSFSMSGLMAAFAGGGFSLSSFTSLAGDAAGPLSILTDTVGGLVDGIGQFIAQGAMIVGTIVLFQGFMDAARQVQSLVEQMFQLNEQTQKTAYTWKYLFGGGAQGWGISQNLMNWTAQASLTMPYTRQDIMQAITSMLSINGMTEGSIQKYLPMLSDLGASRNPNMNLAGIVNAVVGAEFGYTRMLRYDLHINPQDLAKYGLKIDKRDRITDPKTFLPALFAYAKAKGYLGAGQDIAQNTWWGAWSSFVDRMQNMGLEIGGLDQSGAAKPNSFFGALMKDLTNVSGWLDSHKDDLKFLFDLVGHLVGGVVEAGGGLLGAMFQALGQSDLLGGFVGSLHQADQLISGMLGSPEQQVSAAGTGRTSGAHGGRRVSSGVTRYLTGQAGQTGRVNQFALWGQELAPLVEEALKLADAFGQFALSVGEVAGSGLMGFLAGFSKFHVDKTLIDFFDRIGKALNTPQMKEYEGMLGSLLGTLAGFAANAGLQALEQFILGDLTTLVGMEPAIKKAFDEMVAGFKNLGNSFTPQEKQAMEVVGGFLLRLAGSMVALAVLQGLGMAFLFLATVLNGLATAVQSVNNAWQWLQQHLDMRKWADDLKKAMEGWGGDMMDAFIKGIQSKMPKLNAAIGGIAGAIHSQLHFSKPDTGPLADSDTWMPDMMRQLASGMERNLHQVASASRRVAQTMADPLGDQRAFVSGRMGGYGGVYSSAYTDARASHANINVYGQNPQAINQLIDDRLRVKDAQARLNLYQPGGFRRFGDVGANPALG